MLIYRLKAIIDKQNPLFHQKNRTGCMQKMMTKLLHKRYGVLFLSSYKTISKTFPLFFIFPLVFWFFHTYIIMGWKLQQRVIAKDTIQSKPSAIIFTEHLRKGADIDDNPLCRHQKPWWRAADWHLFSDAGGKGNLHQRSNWWWHLLSCNSRASLFGSICTWKNHKPALYKHFHLPDYLRIRAI